MGNAPSTPSSSSALPADHPPTPRSSSPEACPVDHHSRIAWLKASQKQASSSLPPNHPNTSAASPEECPVDHKSRQAWLNLAQRKQPTDPNATLSNGPIRPRITNSRLSAHREISSIPRAQIEIAAPAPASSGPSSTESCALPPASPNRQTPDPHTSKEGTWIYPSEEMFFNAMKRKSFKPREEDMSSVIPIHNAVNERTWSEILRWERPYNAPAGQCGGPKLVSFAGDSTKLSPRARWNVMLGYESPFDRHDWVVDRCGTKVEYVIDYYQGKAPAGEKGARGPSFYLDVRPKLNSWEGVKMRMLKATGLTGG